MEARWRLASTCRLRSCSRSLRQPQRTAQAARLKQKHRSYLLRFMGDNMKHILHAVVFLIIVSNLARAQDFKTAPAKLHRELTSTREAWQNIPWHLSLLEARTQAAKEN